VSEQKSGGGLRFSTGKLRLELIPVEWLVELARVMTVGATKYEERNWEAGMPWSQCLGPLNRHKARWEAGHIVDAETKCHELAMVAWNALALMSYELRGLGTDDRSKVAIGADFKWTEGPGTALGMSSEELAALSERYAAQRGEAATAQGESAPDTSGCAVVEIDDGEAEISDEDFPNEWVVSIRGAWYLNVPEGFKDKVRKGMRVFARRVGPAVLGIGDNYEFVAEAPPDTPLTVGNESTAQEIRAAGGDP
jgi:hypothetical protein